MRTIRTIVVKRIRQYSCRIVSKRFDRWPERAHSSRIALKRSMPTATAARTIIKIKRTVKKVLRLEMRRGEILGGRNKQSFHKSFDAFDEMRGFNGVISRVGDVRQIP